MDTLTSKAEDVPRTPIQDFYSYSNIFITGGTGFLGKILIEKLLWTCPHISTMYVLVRNKKGKSTKERIDNMFDEPLFERLKADFPDFRNKVVAIPGDIGERKLGISDEDKLLLQEKVNIVFHVAATVKFDEIIQKAVTFNIKAVQEMVCLAKGIQNLKSFIHVSTLYSQCINPVIEEKFYSPPIDYTKLITLTDNMDDAFLEKITPVLLDSHPNTYSYTKAVAEDVIRREGGDLPISVFRPSIVISTYKEPIKGWIDNLYGPTGAAAAASNGLLRCLHVDKNKNANLIPADMCANALIAVGWETAQNRHLEIPIYHYESSNDKPIDWETYMGMASKYGLDFISIKAIWYCTLVLIKSKFWFTVSFFLMSHIPAVILDKILIIIGKKPKFEAYVKKIQKFVEAISFFATREWEVKSTRVRTMINSMEDKDKTLFFCDLKLLDYNEYFQEYFKGIRVYLIKDPLTTLDAALKRYKRLFWIHQSLKVLLGFACVRLTWFTLNWLIPKSL